MKTAFRALAGAALAACIAAPALAGESSDEAAIRKLKTETWPTIYAQNDADALAAFLADDFVLIVGGSVTPKADEVEWMRTSSWDAPDDFVYEVVDVVFITPDAAIVYGRGLSTRTDDDGAPCRHSYWSSNTLRREGETWRPVSSQVSDAKCEPL